MIYPSKTTFEIVGKKRLRRPVPDIECPDLRVVGQGRTGDGTQEGGSEFAGNGRHAENCFSGETPELFGDNAGKSLSQIDAAD